MAGLSRHARDDSVGRSTWTKLSGRNRISNDRCSDICVEIAVVKRDAGVAAASKPLDHISASVPVCVAQANDAGRYRGHWSALRFLEIYEHVAVWSDNEVSSRADRVGENRSAESRWESEPAVVSCTRGRIDYDGSSFLRLSTIARLCGCARGYCDESQ